MLIDYTNGYAWALLALARDDNKHQQIKKDSHVLLSVLNENKELIPLFSSNLLKREDIESITSNAFKGLNKQLINFINLVSVKNRAKYIVPVLKKLISLINVDLNIKEGIVYTPIALNSKQIAQIEVKIGQTLGFKPVLINKLDPTLISGFKVIVDDQVIEDSIISRIHNLKYSLIRGGK